jgi:hypothetical protein
MGIRFYCPDLKVVLSYPAVILMALSGISGTAVPPGKIYRGNIHISAGTFILGVLKNRLAFIDDAEKEVTKDEGTEPAHSNTGGCHEDD